MHLICVFKRILFVFLSAFLSKSSNCVTFGLSSQFSKSAKTVPTQIEGCLVGGLSVFSVIKHLVVLGLSGVMMALLLSTVMASMVSTDTGTVAREMNWLTEQ